MAVTVATTQHRRVKFIGGKKCVLCNLTLTGTYVAATGIPATTLTPGIFGLSRLDNLVFMDKVNAIGAIPQWTRATGLLTLFGTPAVVSTPFEAAGLNTDTVTGGLRVMAIGT